MSDADLVSILTNKRKVLAASLLLAFPCHDALYTRPLTYWLGSGKLVCQAEA